MSPVAPAPLPLRASLSPVSPARLQASVSPVPPAILRAPVFPVPPAILRSAVAPPSTRLFMALRHVSSSFVTRYLTQYQKRNVLTDDQIVLQPTSVPESSAPAVPSSSVPATSAPASTLTSTVVVVPTASVTTCPTTGVYTFPATTITVTEDTTVCEATSTQVPSGTHTVGGVTTVVETETTVVCPYATTTSVSGEVTSTVLTTTYVCPSAGTYTIAPMTTTCSESTIWVYPTPASFTPGEYTRPANTVTVSETDYVYVCPFSAPTTSIVVAPPASSVPASSIPASSSPAQPASSAPASSSSSPKPSSPSSSTGLGNPGGKQWAMTYTPYSANGQCKSAEDVMTDIKAVSAAGFTSIRLYSTDCSGLENVGSACKAAGIKMIIGIFIEASGISGAQEQVTDIIAWAQFDIVELIVIGNEAVFNGYCSASDLAAFITSCKSAFSGAGYSGPCTTTEPVDVWQSNHETLCAVVDIVAFQGHPFYNAGTDAASAGTFVQSQFDIMNALCPGKSESYNLECGWPSAGSCNDKACPGTSEQVTAIQAISSATGGITVIMSTFDDDWKPAGQFDEDQHWGALHCYQ